MKNMTPQQRNEQQRKEREYWEKERRERIDRQHKIVSDSLDRCM